MLRRLPLYALGTVMLVSACTTTAPSISQPQSPSVQYQVQQDESEGSDDASLDALIRQLDAGGDDQATPSASPAPAQSQGLDRLQVQQGSWGGGGGWYGGYGYGIFSRCMRVYRRCLNSRMTYGGYGTFRLCRRLRNRCLRSQWWR